MYTQVLFGVVIVSLSWAVGARALSDTASVNASMSGAADALTIENFTVVNADTDADIATVSGNGTVSLSGSPRLNVRANTGDAGSVVFTLGSETTTEDVAPFALRSNAGADYVSSWAPAPGTYTVTATAFSGDDGQGTAGPTAVLELTVVAGGSAPTSAPKPEPQPTPESVPTTEPKPTSTPTPTPTGAEPPRGGGSVTDAAAQGYSRVTCPSPTATVSTAEELTTALDAAGPGTVIRLEDGEYVGKFSTTASGSAAKPAWLCGGPGAMVTFDRSDTGFVMHLDGASHWRLVGFSVAGGQKGVMVDGSTGSVIQGLAVSGSGYEAIHLRKNSSDNLVVGNTVMSAGLVKPEYGEGIYVGSSESNWCDLTDCEPDRSDRNIVAENTVSGTTAETVDIKEGTTGGLLIGNTLDGSDVTAVDSAVDVKGNDWVVKNNKVTPAPLLDGIQTNLLENGWGRGNLFSGNVITDVEVRREVTGRFELRSTPTDRFGIRLRSTGNTVTCDNRVSPGLDLASEQCSQ
ncbi:MAG: hypothetical protein ACRCXL_17015 [Dermatophilaceae bacterium]